MSFQWQRLVEDHKRFFWFLHTMGWSGFALVHYLGSLVHEMRDIYLFVILLNAYAGWLLTIPLRYVFHHVWNKHPAILLMVISASSYIVGTIWTIVKNFNMWEIYRHGYRPDEWILYFKDSLGSLYITLCWSGLYFGIKYYQMLQKEREKALKASTIAHEVQLKMLRYQLNPHFLFNTLNAISTLILINDTRTANGMVTRLSEFLRYSLHMDPINRVPLQMEVHALTLYLDIEKVRFEERLTVDIDLEEEAREALVPSMILQPLIENAIKYAIAKSENGGKITVKARVFGHDLLIEVADDGPGTEIVNDKIATPWGVGISNTEERLTALYDGQYSFVLSHADPHGLKINIRIPYELSNTDGKEN